MTFKSGSFKFSRKYSLRETQPLEIESRILNDTIKDLPILPSLSAKLNQELIRRSIFGTAAIEGNPLSEEKVAELIQDTDYALTKNNPEIEIKNLTRAYEILKDFRVSDKPFEISEDEIKIIHKIITDGIINQENNPGHYRNHKVQVSDKNHGGVYTPPKCLDDIKTLMTAFVSWMNSPDVIDLYPPIRAALAHYHLGLIHPFGDGNGRTARLLEATIMQKAGFKYAPVMLSNFYYQNIDDYFWAFSHAIKDQNHFVTSFVSFVLKSLISSLKDLKVRIIDFIRLFSIKDYFNYLKSKKIITQRQFDFLNILIETFDIISVQDLYELPNFKVLYRNVSERTARRDLKKLEDMKILTANKKKEFILNLKMLE